jgi:hypothetical protein
MTNVEAVLPPAPTFFSSDQHAALARVCDLILPAAGSKPGAKEAGASDFLDFLIARSPADRQALYRTGLDRLNGESRRRFAKPFADISDSQAAALLTPLQQSWTFDGPADPVARFLVTVKEDALRATVNSREWAAASTGRRGGSGVGAYWYSME